MGKDDLLGVSLSWEMVAYGVFFSLVLGKCCASVTYFFN